MTVASASAEAASAMPDQDDYAAVAAFPQAHGPLGGMYNTSANMEGDWI
jgi:hypothetical protein